MDLDGAPEQVAEQLGVTLVERRGGAVGHAHHRRVEGRQAEPAGVHGRKRRLGVLARQRAGGRGTGAATP